MPMGTGFPGEGEACAKRAGGARDVEGVWVVKPDGWVRGVREGAAGAGAERRGLCMKVSLVMRWRSSLRAMSYHARGSRESGRLAPRAISSWSQGARPRLNLATCVFGS